MARPTSRGAARVAALVVPAVVAAAVFSLASGASAAPAPGPAVALTPRTVTLPLKVAARRAPAGTAAADVPQLPTFTSSFRYASEHKTYDYTMIGTDPAGPDATTSVETTLTPLSITFADRHVVTPDAKLVRQLRLTGLFSNQSFPGGTGQFGDVYMRTQFWSLMRGGHKNWHVLLKAPVVRPSLSLRVPSAKGGRITTKTGGTVYLIDVGWFDTQLQGRVAAGRPVELTQFLGGDVVLCGAYTPGDLSSCGIGGYHSAASDADGDHTYAYASYLSRTIFGRGSGFYGLAPLSHEIAEWFADPLMGNVVPKWTEPSVPQYGCSSVLEVGDPLVGHVLAVGSVIYQDAAYLSYFSRAEPSTAWSKRYSWFGTFTRYSRGC